MANPTILSMPMATRLTNAPVDEIRADASAHFWPHSKPTGDMSKTTGVQLVTGAEGVWVNDVEGNRWFDTLSGLWLVNIGHGRREIADAVHHQMLQLSFSPHDTVSAATDRSAKNADQSLAFRNKLSGGIGL